MFQVKDSNGRLIRIDPLDVLGVNGGTAVQDNRGNWMMINEHVDTRSQGRVWLADNQSSIVFFNLRVAGLI